MSLGDCEPILDLHLQLALADVQPVFIRNGFDWRTGLQGLETGRWAMSEDVSRRKMLSMLGLGAALGFTLSAALEPLEAEAQEAAPATAAPAATGTHGMQRRQGRRTHRSERRTGRHERRHTRRTGEPAPAAPAPKQ
jgi:hypothetical protein